MSPHWFPHQILQSIGKKHETSTTSWNFEKNQQIPQSSGNKIFRKTHHYKIVSLINCAPIITNMLHIMRCYWDWLIQQHSKQ